MKHAAAALALLAIAAAATFAVRASHRAAPATITPRAAPRDEARVEAVPPRETMTEPPRATSAVVAPSAADTPSPAADPVARQTESKLAKSIDARIKDESMLTVLERLARECELEFHCAPELKSRLAAVRVTMDMSAAPARTVLEYAGEISGFQVDFLNGSVWIKEKRE